MSYRSNLNAAFYSHDLKPLINPTVTTYIDEVIVNSYVDFMGWWGVQTNCDSPPGLTTGYSQYVVISDGGGQLYSEIDYFKANDFLLQYDEISVIDESQYRNENIPAGYSMKWVINTDPVTYNVLGFTLTLYDQNGLIVAVNYSPVTDLVGWQNAWFTPITTLSIELGSLGGYYSDYTSGAGRIFYTPSGGQTYDFVAATQTPAVNSGNPYYPFPAGLAANEDQHTAEQSNMIYSPPISQPGGGYMQRFNTSGIFGVRSNFVVTTVS